jgi:hypothetical protein
MADVFGQPCAGTKEKVLPGERKCRVDCNCQYVAGWYTTLQKEIKTHFRTRMNPAEREETIKGRIAAAVQEHPTLANSRSPMRLSFREKMGPLKQIVSFCESCWVELYMLDKPIWFQSVGDQGLIDNICSWPTYNRWKRKARHIGELQALVSRDSDRCEGQ